ncbi:SgcJ/EcaC family oxidoreductase [Nocardioides nitrophenolicus]|uniref:SgcJ/EcaC family oxidoreductase n=1 Tax=Nocardioides nitrophenolicus TaxID=60489 RepID=UPI00195B9E25|nr:SgcJ/EcaC family oxidoreductase [Nocardioides nitrophenolicus]MBM7515246.1 uncharacterized protein (TIGR02246 family) [Nocardioides nitrophenolicus]
MTTTEIDAVLAETYQAWTDNDADAFVRHYTEDATAVLPGSLRAGRTAIRDAMAASFAGPLAGSTTVDRRRSLRFVGADVAIAVHESGIRLAGESELPEGRTVVATWVFARRDGRWMIAAYHNCPA